MIRSPACQQRQADPVPALAGRHGNRRSYTIPWDTIDAFPCGFGIEGPRQGPGGDFTAMLERTLRQHDLLAADKPATGKYARPYAPAREARRNSACGKHSAFAT